MPTHVHPARQTGRSLVPDDRKPFETIQFLCRLLPFHGVGIEVVLWRDLRRRLLLLGGRGIGSFLGLDLVLLGLTGAMDLILGRRWRRIPSSAACQFRMYE